MSAPTEVRSLAERCLDALDNDEGARHPLLVMMQHWREERPALTSAAYDWCLLAGRRLIAAGALDVRRAAAEHAGDDEVARLAFFAEVTDIFAERHL